MLKWTQSKTRCKDSLWFRCSKQPREVRKWITHSENCMCTLPHPSHPGVWCHFKRRENGKQRRCECDVTPVKAECPSTSRPIPISYAGSMSIAAHSSQMKGQHSSCFLTLTSLSRYLRAHWSGLHDTTVLEEHGHFKHSYPASSVLCSWLSITIENSFGPHRFLETGLVGTWPKLHRTHTGSFRCKSHNFFHANLSLIPTPALTSLGPWE